MIKENYDYSSYTNCKAGLLNSATFTANAIEKYTNDHAIIEYCIDGNSIDAKVDKYKPDYCILEAIWVTPDKIRELSLLHKQVTFIVRVHSKFPFLATEGVAIGWLKEIDLIPNVYIAFNNYHSAKDFTILGEPSMYLPNIYADVDKVKIPLFAALQDSGFHNKEVNIGCFGAIRPMKNQLIQAVAAIGYADKFAKTLNFHMNSRYEQNGQQVIKNIRDAFKGTKHNLIEHAWLDHVEFTKLVSTMDIGLQVSMSESFNIVSADFVAMNVPIVVSEDIEWMPNMTKVETFDTTQMINKIALLLKKRSYITALAKNCLYEYNKNALIAWKSEIL